MPSSAKLTVPVVLSNWYATLFSLTPLKHSSSVCKDERKCRVVPRRYCYLWWVNFNYQRCLVTQLSGGKLIRCLFKMEASWMVMSSSNECKIMFITLRISFQKWPFTNEHQNKYRKRNLCLNFLDITYFLDIKISYSHCYRIIVL